MSILAVMDAISIFRDAIVSCFSAIWDAYDYGVVDKKMFPTIDDLRKAITAFQVDGECVSIRSEEHTSELQEFTRQILF